MRNIKIIFSVSLIIFIIHSAPVFSQVVLDIETGAVFSGYNDIRIPGDEGTLFSLSEE